MSGDKLAFQKHRKVDLGNELSSALRPGNEICSSLTELPIRVALEGLAGRVQNLLMLLDLHAQEIECSAKLAVVRDLARAFAAVLQIASPSSAPLRPSAVVEEQAGCAGAPATLTRRQRDVLQLLVQGKSNKQIARALDLGEGTVKVHVAALFRSLGVANRARAAAVGADILTSYDSMLSDLDLGSRRSGQLRCAI